MGAEPRHRLPVRGLGPALVYPSGDSWVGVPRELGDDLVGDALLHEQGAEIVAQSMHGVVGQPSSLAYTLEHAIDVARLKESSDQREEHIAGDFSALVGGPMPT